MPSPFPGMDPFLEANPIFQELHTQMLAEMQALLQPQLGPAMSHAWNGICPRAAFGIRLRALSPWSAKNRMSPS